MKRKPFDLEAAKRGEPVVTRNGRRWFYGCVMTEAALAFRLVGLVEGNGAPETWYESGSFEGGKSDSDYDLFMAPCRVQAWARLAWTPGYGFWLATRIATEGQEPRDWQEPVPGWNMLAGVRWLSDPVKVGEPQDVQDDEPEGDE